MRSLSGSRRTLHLLRAASLPPLRALQEPAPQNRSSSSGLLACPTHAETRYWLPSAGRPPSPRDPIVDHAETVPTARPHPEGWVIEAESALRELVAHCNLPANDLLADLRIERILYCERVVDARRPKVGCGFHAAAVSPCRGERIGHFFNPILLHRISSPFDDRGLGDFAKSPGGPARSSGPCAHRLW